MSSGQKFSDSKERLTILDQKGYRLFRQTMDVSGFFKTWRLRVYNILIFILLVLPWITIKGEQAILFDIPHRRFTFFGIHFWGHDAPLIFFILGFATIGLAIATTLWGRIWCGWACPQTVFIEGVFRRIERFIEGSHIQRLALDKKAWDLAKIRKKTLKWSLYFIFSFIISHSLLAYFIPKEDVLKMMLLSPQLNLVPFLFVVLTTLLVMFNFGWFREQFCIIVCPYGRLQSLLMDTRSMAVLYDHNRGEPRGKKSSSTSSGDCIDCFKCVKVCPTGIDIRDGIQMECISCTACIDICDDVMDKVKRPRGLIRYSNESIINGAPKTSNLRVMLYGVLFILLSLGFTHSLSRRSDIDASFIRAATTPFIKSDDDIKNQFKLYLKNQTQHNVKFLSVSSTDINIKTISPAFPITVPPEGLVRTVVFISIPLAHTELYKTNKVILEVKLEDTNKKRTIIKEVSFVGPN